MPNIKMRTRTAVLFLLAGGFCLRAQAPQLQRFAFQGQPYSIHAGFAPGRADLLLRGDGEKNLSAEMEGENVLLGFRTGMEDFYVFWLHHGPQGIRLAYYDHRLDLSRRLPVSGFTFFALPEIVEEGGALRGLAFLGNRSGNDDIFYYDLEAEALMQLTATPFSEKGFALVNEGGLLTIETRSLWARYRYRLDAAAGQAVLLEKSLLPAGRAATAAPSPSNYFNTYLGFGDSITWGKIDGIQQPSKCFLYQMKALLADPAYVNYYGASYYANLGVPGDTTTDGAERVNQDLALYPGFYLLLLLGTNDLIDSSLSVDSSLENLATIIDAALERGMRVIVSTVTPSKSLFASYDYFQTNLALLNAGILELAAEKRVASIDAYTAFMATAPPDGWKALLEEVVAGAGSGTHPNESGHAVIAALFAAALVRFPPVAPQDVTVLDPLDPLRRTASWSANSESDFSHFLVEFGFQPGKLPYSLATTGSSYSFSLFPFLPQLVFRIKAVDRGDRSSAFSSPTQGSDPPAEPALARDPAGRLKAERDR
jgi:lysophospholipase L1-like esterase